MRPLFAYFMLLAMIYLTSELFFRASQIEWWHQQFLYANVSFTVMMLGEQFIRVAVSFAMIATLLLLVHLGVNSYTVLDWLETRFLSKTWFLKLSTYLCRAVLGFRRRDFFLVKGQLDAPAAPEWLFGMKEAEPWTRFGWKFMIGMWAGGDCHRLGEFW